MPNRRAHLGIALACATPLAALAIQVCDLDGVAVNPNNGNETAGKSGTMRCRDGDTGQLRREQQLQRGVFMGSARWYKDGILEREHSVNERGNRDGLAREYAASQGPRNPLLREETYRDGQSVGLARSWYPEGPLRRVSFHGDDGREQAVAEFQRDGRLADLRCGPRPLLAPAADDAAWCGHAGPATVTLYGASGAAKSHLTHDRGERRRVETLWENGRTREVWQREGDGGFERRLAADGVRRYESRWVDVPRADAPARRVTVLEQEFAESGTLVRESRWRATERGRESAFERHWYLNGQPRDAQEFVSVDGQALRRDTAFHDNGRKASEGAWALGARGDARAFGVHSRYDPQGHLRAETHYDARGQVAREREFDESGRVTRDDEVFADGSRKAYSR